jgi:hypothetical protein
MIKNCGMDFPHLGDPGMVSVDIDPLRGECPRVLLVPDNGEKVATLVNLNLKFVGYRIEIFDLLQTQSSNSSKLIKNLLKNNKK